MIAATTGMWIGMGIWFGIWLAITGPALVIYLVTNPKKSSESLGR